MKRSLLKQLIREVIEESLESPTQQAHRYSELTMRQKYPQGHADEDHLKYAIYNAFITGWHCAEKHGARV